MRSEFLVYIRVVLPAALDTSERNSWHRMQGERIAELAKTGTCRRLWRDPGTWDAVWGLWEAEDVTELHAVLGSLPKARFSEVTIHALAVCLDDPARDGHWNIQPSTVGREPPEVTSDAHGAHDYH